MVYADTAERRGVVEKRSARHLLIRYSCFHSLYSGRHCGALGRAFAMRGAWSCDGILSEVTLQSHPEHKASPHFRHQMEYFIQYRTSQPNILFEYYNMIDSLATSPSFTTTDTLMATVNSTHIQPAMHANSGQPTPPNRLQCIPCCIIQALSKRSIDTILYKTPA